MPLVPLCCSLLEDMLKCCACVFVIVTYSSGSQLCGKACLAVSGLKSNIIQHYCWFSDPCCCQSQQYSRFSSVLQHWHGFFKISEEMESVESWETSFTVVSWRVNYHSWHRFPLSPSPPFFLLVYTCLLIYKPISVMILTEACHISITLVRKRCVSFIPALSCSVVPVWFSPPPSVLFIWPLTTLYCL